MELTPRSHHWHLPSRHKTLVCVPESHRPQFNKKKNSYFYCAVNLDGAEVHEERDEREDGLSEAPTQTTETQAQAHARRIGRLGEAYTERCPYSTRNFCGFHLRSDVS